MTEFVSLASLCREHGRIPSTVLEALWRERSADIGLPRPLADELAEQWQREDAERTEAELARQRAQVAKAERERLFRQGESLHARMKGCQLDLQFTQQQIDKTSYVEDLKRLEARKESELDDWQAALDAWQAWSKAHPEMSEAVLLAAEKGLPARESQAFVPPKPNWMDEGVWA